MAIIWPLNGCQWIGARRHSYRGGHVHGGPSCRKGIWPCSSRPLAMQPRIVCSNKLIKAVLITAFTELLFHFGGCGTMVQSLGRGRRSGCLVLPPLLALRSFAPGSVLSEVVFHLQSAEGGTQLRICDPLDLESHEQVLSRPAQ
jgi:hypothetical protein